MIGFLLALGLTVLTVGGIVYLLNDEQSRQRRKVQSSGENARTIGQGPGHAR